MKEQFDKAARAAIAKSKKAFEKEGLKFRAIQVFFTEDEKRRGTAVSAMNVSVGNTMDAIESLVDLIAEQEEVEQLEALAMVSARMIAKA